MYWWGLVCNTSKFIHSLINMDPATDHITSHAFNTWLGGESSNWTEAANWSKGAFSTSSDSVGIKKIIFNCLNLCMIK